nr:sugar transferase [uncultured Sellimonas sp.]
MYKKYVKRILDILVSVCVLPFVALVIIFFGFLIWLEDRGSIFYLGSRVGKNARVFKMYKLRTMKMNAPDIRLEDGSTYNSEDDPRVTKIGRFLRKTSIDELPQFINILVGDMSLIGPRPHTPLVLNKMTEEIREKLQIRPGLTGYSQAFYRNSIAEKEKNKKDLYYVRNVSFRFDLKIIFKTINTVLKRENIYKE